MLFAVVLALGALVGPMIDARPASAPYVKAMAKYYAKLHPNTDPINEEYGDLYDGDIILQEGQKIETNPLNAVTNPNLLWPRGIAYYTIANGQYTAQEVTLIEAGIRDLQELTKKANGEFCIQILPRNNEGDYIRVENYSGCSSYVGRIGGSQRMSLVPSCVTRHGTIMHEFLHAFGFHHEQKRYDRDDWVTINWDNIQPGTENNFVMLPPSQINLLGTQYDYGSVLHYSAYAFAVDPNVPTIITHDPNAVIGQRVTLSKLDIERVQILYGCLNPADSVYFRHIKSRESLFQ